MDGYYDDISGGYNSLHGEEQLRKAGLILSQIVLDDSSKILDVGGGTGIATEHFPGHVTVLDPSEKLLSFVKGDKVMGVAEKLPFKEKTFDLVISLTAMHHFQDPKLAMEEMKRVSRKYVAVSILKRSKTFEELKRIFLQAFPSPKEIDDTHDLILLKEY